MRADSKFDEFVASLYLKTRSIRQVSSRLSIGLSTVSRILHRVGIQPPDRLSAEVHERKKRFRDDQAQAVATDYAAGMSMLALKRKYKCGPGAIKTAVRDIGVPVRPKGGPLRRFSLEESQEMAALYVDGWSQPAIATKFKTSALMVSRLLKLAGVKTRRTGVAHSEHPGWKGGRVVMNAGYVGVMLAHDDPLRIMANVSGYVPEHRIGNHGAGVVAACGKCGSSEVIYEPIKSTKPIIVKQDS